MHVRVRGSNQLILVSLNILGGGCLWKLLWFKLSLASYGTVHVIVASVLASTLSTTSLAALPSFLLSRSTCSTIFPWASMPTYRDKEIDFKIAEKYYCWKQNKSSWKNQYLSSQEGEGGGLCRSVPAAHQTGRSSNLNVSGGSCDLPVQGLRVIWNFSSTQKSRLLPPTWERLDCRHCTRGWRSRRKSSRRRWSSRRWPGWRRSSPGWVKMVCLIFSVQWYKVWEQLCFTILVG